MRKIPLALAIALLTFQLPLAAQSALNEGQGHPLKGVWLGDWGPNANTRNPVVIEMDWDGKAISGTINPGPEGVKFTKADLNPDTWSVHVEAAQGATRIVIDGKIENLGSLSRAISGTWTQGNQKGTFKITRH